MNTYGEENNLCYFDEETNLCYFKILDTVCQKFDEFEDGDAWHDSSYSRTRFTDENYGIDYNSVDNRLVAVGETGSNNYGKIKNSDDKIETHTESFSWASIINSSIKKNFKPNPTFVISDFLPKRTLRTSTRNKTEYSKQIKVFNKQINKCKSKKSSKITKVRIGDIYFYENSKPFK